MLVPYVTITNIALYESDEKLAEIRLFNKNTLKKQRFFDSVWDTHLKMYNSQAQGVVCKVIGMIFRCIKNYICNSYIGDQHI